MLAASVGIDTRNGLADKVQALREIDFFGPTRQGLNLETPDLYLITCFSISGVCRWIENGLFPIRHSIKSARCPPEIYGICLWENYWCHMIVFSGAQTRKIIFEAVIVAPKKIMQKSCYFRGRWRTYLGRSQTVTHSFTSCGKFSYEAQITSLRLRRYIPGNRWEFWGILLHPSFRRSARDRTVCLEYMEGIAISEGLMHLIAAE